MAMLAPPKDAAAEGAGGLSTEGAGDGPMGPIDGAMGGAGGDDGSIGGIPRGDAPAFGGITGGRMVAGGGASTAGGGASMADGDIVGDGPGA